MKHAWLHSFLSKHLLLCLKNCISSIDGPMAFHMKNLLVKAGITNKTSSMCNHCQKQLTLNGERGTVIFLSFRTDRSGQTVQTQRSSLIRVYTVCNSLYIFWMHYSTEKPSCSTFWVITINFRVSEILGFLRYKN